MKLTFEERRQISDIRRAARSREPKKPRSPKADRGRVMEPLYLAFLRRQRCAIAGRNGHRCEGAVQAAHIRAHKPGERPTGLQRKPDDRRATPLCALAHHQQHHAHVDEVRWWASYGLDPFEVADEHYARYEGGNDGRDA